MEIEELFNELMSTDVGGEIDSDTAEFDEDKGTVTFSTWDGRKYCISLREMK